MIKSYPAFVFALVVLLVGINMLIKRILQKKRNIFKIQATIVDYIEEGSETDTGYSVIYYPVLKYQVDDKEYINKSEYGLNKKRNQIGSKILIDYNPNNPNDFNLSGSVISWILPIVVTSVGIAVMILMIK